MRIRHILLFIGRSIALSTSASEMVLPGLHAALCRGEFGCFLTTLLIAKEEEALMLLTWLITYYLYSF